MPVAPSERRSSFRIALDAGRNGWRSPSGDDLYLAAKKWHMAAVVAKHLVKADPGNPAAWINLAYAVRRAENIQQAQAILLKARALHPKSAMIAFNLAC